MRKKYLFPIAAVLAALLFFLCSYSRNHTSHQLKTAQNMLTLTASSETGQDQLTLPAIAGNIAQVLPMGSGSVAVLYTDGTVGVSGNKHLAVKTSSWRNVVQLYWGAQPGNIAARMADGIAVSSEYDLSGWHNLKELYVTYEGIIGLTMDGHILGSDYWESSIVTEWTDIINFWTNGYICFGLKNDGTLVSTDAQTYPLISSQMNVQQILFTHQTHINPENGMAVANIYAVLEDGRVVSESCKESELEYLHGAAKFMCDGGWPFGLTVDGHLLARTLENGKVYHNGDCFTFLPESSRAKYPSFNIHDTRFRNIRDIFFHHALIMLKQDGTVDTVNVEFNWDFRGWEQIESLTTSYIGSPPHQPRIYGLRADGSVISAAIGGPNGSFTEDHYLGWNVIGLYSGSESHWSPLSGVIGITREGTLVGDGSYTNTNFSTLIR